MISLGYKAYSSLVKESLTGHGIQFYDFKGIELPVLLMVI